MIVVFLNYFFVVYLFYQLEYYPPSLEKNFNFCDDSFENIFLHYLLMFVTSLHPDLKSSGGQFLFKISLSTILIG